MKFSEKLNTPVAVVEVFAIFLTVDGFLFYRFQERSLPSEKDAGAADMAESATSENEGEPTDEPMAFVHRATSQNIVDDSTYLDQPAATANPDGVLLVEQTSEPGGDIENTSPIGVLYDANRGGRWAIFNQDRSPMPENTTFEVYLWIWK
jgi:hypothetical protein